MFTTETQRHRENPRKGGVKFSVGTSSLGIDTEEAEGAEKTQGKGGAGLSGSPRRRGELATLPWSPSPRCSLPPPCRSSRMTHRYQTLRHPFLGFSPCLCVSVVNR
jgi:hypothetical protein